MTFLPAVRLDTYTINVQWRKIKHDEVKPLKDKKKTMILKEFNFLFAKIKWGGGAQIPLPSSHAYVQNNLPCRWILHEMALNETSRKGPIFTHTCNGIFSIMDWTYTCVIEKTAVT